MERERRGVFRQEHDNLKDIPGVFEYIPDGEREDLFCSLNGASPLAEWLDVCARIIAGDTVSDAAIEHAVNRMVNGRG